MALAQLDQVRKVFDHVRDGANGDGELLARYRAARDQDAFGLLVRRHGPMVLGVCNRVLRDAHAADDAFQATFLVLAKKADAVRPPDRLAPWLYGVAVRTAMKARGRAARRHQVEERYAVQNAPHGPAPEGEGTSLLPVIDEQLNALPEKYRAPLVLCAIQGLNKAEAAEKLGVPEGTVSSRLARGREMLRDRLTRRGVLVPAVALGALLTADALRAAVPLPLAVASTELAAGTALAPQTVLTLSNEVLRSMTWFKLKALCAAALCVTLAAGGVGVYTLAADEKKPAQPGAKKPDGEKPTKPANRNEQNGNNNPNGEGNKPKPDGEKKPKPDGEKKPEGEKPRVIKGGGKVGAVDAKENTIMLAIKGDGGVVEKLYPLAKDAKVLVDGKEAKLDAVPKNATASFLANAAKEGTLPQITELRVTGPVINGIVAKVETTSITLDGEKNPRTVKLAAEGKVTVGGKVAKLSDLPPGTKVVVTLTADESGALTIVSGAKREGDGGDKPEKPLKNQQFGGRVAGVDAAAATVSLVSKGEGGKEMVVKLTPDAKITIDGKAGKIGDIPKSAFATFTLSSAKDGQPREANAVVVAGLTFGGAVKQIDTTSITVGTEKSDRVLKLLPGGKVLLCEKAGELSDLKVGEKVTVTLSSDESGAVLIVRAVAKPTGDKPKPEKE